MWYCDPGWYALPISMVALIVSFFTFRRSGRKALSDVEAAIAARSNEINEAFVRHGIDGPFARELKDSAKASADFPKKVALLFLHINLLKYIHQHLDILGPAAKQYWSDWGSKTLVRWIQSDAELQSIWGKEVESRRPADKEFIDWLTSFSCRAGENGKT